VLKNPGLSLELSDVNRTTFPFPTLGNELEELSLCIHEGRGFFVRRGLDPTVFSKQVNAVLYLGLSSYIAERRGRQNQDGMMLSKYGISLPRAFNAHIWPTSRTLPH
jgi:hypothetical protein